MHLQRSTEGNEIFRYHNNLKCSPFGYSYEYAQTKTNTRIKLHKFDAAAVEILKDDVKKFVDYLHTGFLA
jgi:hypothetical protein